MILNERLVTDSVSCRLRGSACFAFIFLYPLDRSRIFVFCYVPNKLCARQVSARSKSASPDLDYKYNIASAETGRPGGNRTPNLRFWRPPLCQLSYWPTDCHNTCRFTYRLQTRQMAEVKTLSARSKKYSDFRYRPSLTCPSNSQIACYINAIVAAIHSDQDQNAPTKRLL